MNSGVEKKWEDIEREYFSPEDIAEGDLIADVIRCLIDARERGELSQKDLEELTGIRQPVISRIERGNVIPKVDTLIKLLAPLGKTIAVVPLKKAGV